MKRAIAYLLLIVLIQQSLGFYTYCAFNLLRRRQEMQTRLRSTPHSRMRKITLSKEDFSARRADEHEIMLNDQMYDIASIEEQGDLLTIYALPDDEETILRELLDDSFDAAQHNKHGASSLAIALSGMLYLFHDFQFCLKDLLAHTANSLYQIACKHFQLPVISPPPESLAA